MKQKLFHADWELILFIQDPEDKNIGLISQPYNKSFWKNIMYVKKQSLHSDKILLTHVKATIFLQGSRRSWLTQKEQAFSFTEWFNFFCHRKEDVLGRFLWSLSLKTDLSVDYIKNSLWYTIVNCL